MNRPLLTHALACLAHPVSVGAALLLTVNALVFQKLWPAWWTGKLGNAAGLVFLPFLFALLLGLILPSGRVSRRGAGLLALAAVGAGFALIKCLPAANEAAVQLLRALGFAPKLMLDPTDLLALPALGAAWWVWNPSRGKPPCLPRSLPALGAAWWVWNRQASARPAGAARLAAAALAALALMADQAGPQDLGFTCVAVSGDGFLAYRQTHDLGGYFGKPHNVWTAAYRSADNGQTWEAIDRPDEEFTCPNPAIKWPVSTPGSAAQLFWVEGRGVYRSEDGGETLRLEQPAREAHSLAVHEASGKVVLAAGMEGVLLRAPDGVWTVVLP